MRIGKPTRHRLTGLQAAREPVSRTHLSKAARWRFGRDCVRVAVSPTKDRTARLLLYSACDLKSDADLREQAQWSLVRPWVAVPPAHNPAVDPHTAGETVRSVASADLAKPR